MHISKQIYFWLTATIKWLFYLLEILQLKEVNFLHKLLTKFAQLEWIEWEQMKQFVLRAEISQVRALRAKINHCQLSGCLRFCGNSSFAKSSLHCWSSQESA
jgi:hypothetical protein